MTLIHRPTAAAAAVPPFAAGCTALQLSWGEREPDTLTDLSALPQARGIDIAAGVLRVGAMETLERCRTHPLVREHAPLLTQACGVVGALGVRLLGTLGGNIGWRQGDTVPALLALGASVQTVDGLLPLEDLLRLADMPLILAVHLPRQPDVAVFEKIGHRAAFSLSAATVAGCVDGGTVRLAFSASGIPARRLPRSEAMFGAPPARLEAQLAEEIAGPMGAVAARVLSGLLSEGPPQCST